jgi:membrane-associated phospholipid phosphatase
MHSLPLIDFITDLADQAVILPLVLAVLVLLMALGEARAALWWVVAIAVALGGVLIAKIVFIPCGHLLPVLAIQSPSGHTASAAAAYGGLMVLAAQAMGSPANGPDQVRRYAALGLGTLVVAVVALSRILLHAHTVPETLLGAAIGITAPLMLMVPQPLFVGGAVRRRRWLLAVPLLVIPLMLGQQMNAERWITRLAWEAARAIHACEA